MSLIDNAMKAAQREKARREAQRRPSAPLLIPLKAQPSRPSFSSARNIALVAVGVLMVVAALTQYRRVNSNRPPLPLVPALTGAILSEALAADTSSHRTISSADRVARADSAFA